MWRGAPTAPSLPLEWEGCDGRIVSAVRDHRRALLGCPLGANGDANVFAEGMRIDDEDPSPPVADVATSIDDFDAKTIVILQRRDHFESSHRDDSAISSGPSTMSRASSRASA